MQQIAKTVCNKTTYESYVLRRVNKSLKSLPKEIKVKFAKNIQIWIDNNGKQYTVKRLKDIKQIILSDYSEIHSHQTHAHFDQSQFSSTIAMRNGCTMKGYLGELQKRSIESPKVLEQALILIQAYTLIIDEETTPKDIDDLLSIIEPRPEQLAQDYIDLFCLDIKAPKLRIFYKNVLSNVNKNSEVYHLIDNKCTLVEEQYKKDMSYLLKKPIGLPAPYSISQPTQAHENNYFFSEVVTFYNSKIGHDILELIPELWEDNILPHANSFCHQSPYYPVGRMNLLNEGGLKKRWVENTKHIIQHIVRPFGQRLYDLVKYSPWDCTFNENKGIDTIQLRLRQGLVCYSVDLSKATDKIPMDYNVAVLNKLLGGVPDALNNIKVFNLIAKAHVLLPDISKRYPEYNELYTRWGTGQPMGAFPSFAMLSLVHGIILFILNGYKYENDFVIHGDDVVILNDTLFSKYVKFLTMSGMEYSPYKTIKGSTFAEMNSKIILADKVLTPVKWKEINIKNCLDMAPYWGIELTTLLARNKQFDKDIIKDVLSLPYPLGAGLNPDGLDLESRLTKFPNLIDSLLEDSGDKSYIGSYRDLVYQRYSKFAVSRDSSIDYEWFQALLGDLQNADIADRQCVQKNELFLQNTITSLRASRSHLNIDGHVFNLQYNDTEEYTFLNRYLLSGKMSQRLGKVLSVEIISKDKQRKKDTHTHFKHVASLHASKVK
jgi:hypothetical protein